MSDNVNHPEHYTKGGIECIEAIRASMPDEEFRGYLKGNSLKYLWRYENKGKPEEDLAKANWYLDRLKTMCAEPEPIKEKEDDWYTAIKTIADHYGLTSILMRAKLEVGKLLDSVHSSLVDTVYLGLDGHTMNKHTLDELVDEMSTLAILIDQITYLTGTEERVLRQVSDKLDRDMKKIQEETEDGRR